MIIAMDSTSHSVQDEIKWLSAWGEIFRREGKFQEAIAAFRGLLERAPDHVEALNSLGAVYYTLGYESEAFTSFQRALSIAPNHVLANCNLGTWQLDQNQPEAAIEAYSRALVTDTTHAHARTFLGLAQLVNGELNKGWINYESRWGAGAVKPKHINRTPWLGSPPIQGRSLLLCADQGLGDMIQFSRFIAPLVPQVGSLVVEVPAPLERLFHLSFASVATVVSTETPLIQCDEVSTLASLPLVFGTELHSIPAGVPYLKQPELKPELNALISTQNRKTRIGLVWAGSRTHNKDKDRSIPLDTFRSVYSNINADFFSLQKDIRESDVPLLEKTQEVISLGANLVDLADTASVIAALDLVITVDTSVAHLAGALGKPVWILLPYCPDWRWLLRRSDSPWYPTARLFRQHRRNDWSVVLDEANAALREFVAMHDNINRHSN